MPCQHGQSSERLHSFIIVWSCDAIEQVCDNIRIVDSTFAENLGSDLLYRKSRVPQQPVKRLQLKRIFGVLSDVSRLGKWWWDDTGVAHYCETSDDSAHDTEACNTYPNKYDSLVPRERDELVGPAHFIRG